MVAILCVATCHLHYEVARWVSGAYLENKGGGCLVTREARRDFGHALFTTQESDVYRNIT